MKRYAPMLITIACLFVMIIAGSTYLASAPKDNETRPRVEIVAYTTLPMEAIIPLVESYEREYGVRVNFSSLSPDEILRRLKEQSHTDGGSVALVLGDAYTLEQAAVAGYLVPYLSEASDQVQDRFRHSQGFWTGVWYDPIVFCVNRDYLRTHLDIPSDWQQLSAQKDIRIGITDFMAADATANLYYSMVMHYGEAETLRLWSAMQPQIVQYSKFLSTPVRQAGMGEIDVAVAVLSETLRYVNEGYPLHVIYPSSGTARMLFATGIAFKAKEKDAREAEIFADWLLTDEAMLALDKNKFYFLTTNPTTLSYKTFAGKNINIFDNEPQYSKSERMEILDRWMKEVRFR